MKATSRISQNWYIHLLYTRKDFNECLKVIEGQLKACNGQSDYALYIKALILRQQGRIEESLTTFQAALCMNPLNVNNLKQVGRSLFLIGKHKTALDVLEEAEKLSPDDREILHNKGMCYLYLKQYDVAISSFDDANSILRHEQTFMQLGRCYRLSGSDENALQTYLEAEELSPESSELLTTIGLLYLKLGNNSKAFEYLGKSLSYDAKNPKTILAAGSIIQDNQDMDVALVKYRVAAVRTPNSPQLWNNVGMCFFGKGKYVAAISCLKRAVYLSPFEWIISYNLGIVNLSIGQFASAFHYFSAAINLHPQYSRAYMYLAVALNKLEDFDNACSAYEKAIELGEDYLIHLNYAVTLALNDETERATGHYEKFKTLFDALEDTSEVDEDVGTQASLLRMALGCA